MSNLRTNSSTFEELRLKFPSIDSCEKLENSLHLVQDTTLPRLNLVRAYVFLFPSESTRIRAITHAEWLIENAIDIDLEWMEVGSAYVLADEEKLLKAKEVWKSATKKSGSKLSYAASFFAICDSNESLKYTIRAADHCPLNPELLKNAGLRAFLAGQPQLAIQYFDRLERIPWNQKLYQRVERLITYVPQRPIFSLMGKMPFLFGRNFDNYDITLSTVALEAAVQSKDLRHAEKWSHLLNELMATSGETAFETSLFEATCALIKLSCLIIDRTSATHQIKRLQGSYQSIALPSAFKTLEQTIYCLIEKRWNDALLEIKSGIKNEAHDLEESLKLTSEIDRFLMAN